mgnify:CR=1 FL=1
MSQNTLKTKRQKFSISQYSYVLIFLALFILYYIVNHGLKWTGITNILRHSAVVGVISLGMGIIIITGEIDLSVGAILACVASFGCVLFNVMNNAGLPVAVIFLLTLVQKHKMDLHNIPILELIDQYTRTVEQADPDPEAASAFIEMAARLVEMKSYLLLPRSEEGERMKQELTGQLIEYDQCRRMAALLREKAEAWRLLSTR